MMHHIQRITEQEYYENISKQHIQKLKLIITVKLEYKTYHQIKDLLIILDSYAVTMRHDYNLMSEKGRQDIYEHQLTITRSLRELTGVNAYKAKIEEELKQEQLRGLENSKEFIEEFISTISQELTAMKNPQYYRNYCINKEATSAADLFEVTIQHHPSNPPVEPTYGEEVYSREFWQDAINSQKVPLNPLVEPYFDSIVFFDEDIISASKNFMLGPCGAWRNKAFVAETKTFSSLEELKENILTEAKEKDMVLYKTYRSEKLEFEPNSFKLKEGGPKVYLYNWRGVFLEKSKD